MWLEAIGDYRINKLLSYQAVFKVLEINAEIPHK